MANKERIGITNVLKAIVSKVMKLKLRIHLDCRNQLLDTKGRFKQYLGPNSMFWTLSSTNNTLELFFSHIFQLFFTLFTTFLLFILFSMNVSLFFFLFYSCLIKDFRAHTHTQESLPPHLFFCKSSTKGIPSKLCFTMLQEQGYGWS